MDDEESTDSAAGSGILSETLPLEAKKKGRSEVKVVFYLGGCFYREVGAILNSHTPVRSLNLVTPYSAEPLSRDWSFSAVFRFSWKTRKRWSASKGGKDEINVNSKIITLLTLTDYWPVSPC